MAGLRPMKAIRAYCFECCLKQWHEVNLCPAEGCPIWPFRKGKRKEARKTCKYTATQSIKRKCWDCGGYESNAYRFCGFTDCELWPFVKSRHNALKNGKIEVKETLKLFEGSKKAVGKRRTACDSINPEGFLRGGVGALPPKKV